MTGKAMRSSQDSGNALYRMSHDGNADRVLARHGSKLRYRTDGSWLVWQGDKWCADDLEAQELSLSALRDIRTEADKQPHEQAKQDLLRHAKASECTRAADEALRILRHRRRVDAHELDAHPTRLNVANGTVDLSSGLLAPHDPVDLITRICPTPYELDHSVEHWPKFLDDITDGNIELQEFLQRIAGASLLGDNREHSLVMLIGPGATGKTTFLNALVTAFGPDYTGSLPSEALLARCSNREYYFAELPGKRLVTTVEPAKEKRFDDSSVKLLTGGDMITARTPYGKPFSFIPQATIWLAANQRPDVIAHDSGMWRRIQVAPFSREIPRERRDRDLPAKLESEAPAILAWAVEGAVRVQREGLTIPDVVCDQVASYREDTDEIRAFLEQAVESELRAFCDGLQLYNAYKIFCEREGYRCLGRKGLTQELTARGYVGIRNSTRNRERGWADLRLTQWASDLAAIFVDDQPRNSGVWQ
jgi:putative DNA primase/helicase